MRIFAVLSFIAIMFLVIGSVCAADIDANDTQMISAADDETVSVENDFEPLSANAGTYSELASEIGSGGNVTLKHDYYAYDSGDTIEITQNDSIIDGNGAIIDMAGSTVQAFKVSASGVTIKGLTIKNVNAEYYEGGAIFFSGFGAVENCSFANNTAYNGGAVYFKESGEVANCNFVNNSASENGGAVCFWSYGKSTNCNFTNNVVSCWYADSLGGAILGNDYAEVANCDFAKNTADYGGAVRISRGEVRDCIFADNCATERDGAISILDDGEVTNCSFTNNSAVSGCGAVCISINGKIASCNFVDNHATADAGAVCMVYDGKVTNSNFTANSAACGGAIGIDGNANVTNCNFANNTASDKGGAIYFGDNCSGTVENCSFTNCHDKSGDAIYGSDINVVNSTFTNASESGVKNGTAAFDIEFCDDYYIYGISNSLGLLVPKDIENDVSVEIDGKHYGLDGPRNSFDPYSWVYSGDYQKNGYYVWFDDLKPGNHEVVISYPGDSKYASNSLTRNITVYGQNGDETFDIEFFDDYHIYGETNVFGFLMPKDIGESPLVLIDNNAYNCSAYDVSDPLWVWGGNSQNQTGYMVKFSDLDVGNHEVVISYPGDSKYASCSINRTITVHDDSKITASNVQVTYSAGSYYTIKVYGSDGNPADDVAVKVSGKISKALKTTNGVAKFKVTQAPGSYKITISALGKSVSKTITVKHLLTLKTATVKKSAKKLTLQATLGKINGKYLKNKKITFKFNGKKYTAKTNAKGVAKVTIKSSVLKKLKVGKKVTYQATYLKDTVKKSVKVKK